MDDLSKEIANIRLLMENKTDKQFKATIDAYRRSLTNIQADMFTLFDKYAVDGVLNVSKSKRYAVLADLERQLIEQAKQLGNIDLETTTNVLTDTYEQSYYRTAFLLDSGLTAPVSFSLLSPAFVVAAVNSPIDGTLFSDRIWRNKTDLVNSLRGVIEKGMIQGTDIRKLAREIKKEFEVSTYVSKRLVYTEMSRTMGSAQQQIYSDSGVVQKILWDATLDGKTSEICRARDGQLYELDTVPSFPAHPFERSCLVPVVNGWKPTTKIENVKNADGIKSNIEYANYEDWAKSKGI